VRHFYVLVYLFLFSVWPKFILVVIFVVVIWLCSCFYLCYCWFYHFI